MQPEAGWFELVVTSRKAIAEQVVGLELRSACGDRLPAFDAGSHIDLETPAGVVRNYSLCNAPGEAYCYELGILLESGGRGGSRSVHEDLTVGARVRVRGPRNHFALQPAEHTVLLAGGIGITPLLAMAEQLHADGRSFELHYCVRSRSRAAFLDRLGACPYADRVHLHLDDCAAEQKLDTERVLGRPSQGAQLYVCGPAGFIDYVRAAAHAQGWQDARIHFERFSADPQAACDPGGYFEVVVQGVDGVFTVAPDQSILQCLGKHGVELPMSCEQGICGTCAMRVVSGEPDHRDMFFSDGEHQNQLFTPCCSRSRSTRLVLERI